MPIEKARLGCMIAVCLAISNVAFAADRMIVEITEAEPAYDQRNSRPLVTFRMTEASKRAFAEFTTRNVGKKAEFRLDGRPVMAAMIREPITGGTGQISDNALDVEQVRQLAERLISGKATLEVEIAP